MDQQGHATQKEQECGRCREKGNERVLLQPHCDLKGVHVDTAAENGLDFSGRLGSGGDAILMLLGSSTNG